MTLDDLERHIRGLPKVPAIIPGMGRATDFKSGRYIHRVHPNKSPLKILEKRESGRTQRLTKVDRLAHGGQRGLRI